MTEQVGAVPKNFLSQIATHGHPPTHLLPTITIPGFGKCVDGFIPFSDFHPHLAKAIGSIFIDTVEKKLSWKDRDSVEEDPTWKQVIPYIVITKNNQVFTTLRLKQSAEKRLHGKLSIGVGGHINPRDSVSSKSPYNIVNCAQRELSEEVNINPWTGTLYPIGIVNHDRNSVGSVHMGIVFHAPVSGDTEVSVRETDQLEGSFRDWTSLEPDKLELWAAMILERHQIFLP